mmetsp:Transcript_8630/g.19184  ORF Transcript_8630/g.19184 Transcript_8630/m.19184 type:complete len:267 (+) Transcript_8630:141-941(+)
MHSWHHPSTIRALCRQLTGRRPLSDSVSASSPRAEVVISQQRLPLRLGLGQVPREGQRQAPGNRSEPRTNAEERQDRGAVRIQAPLREKLVQKPETDVGEGGRKVADASESTLDKALLIFSHQLALDAGDDRHQHEERGPTDQGQKDNLRCRDASGEKQRRKYSGAKADLQRHHLTNRSDQSSNSEGETDDARAHCHKKHGHRGLPGDAQISSQVGRGQCVHTSAAQAGENEDDGHSKNDVVPCQHLDGRRKGGRCRSPGPRRVRR